MTVVTTKRRPTQAERSAGTRARVLKSAIKCLYKYGYSATTTLLVAEEAKISRGAMLHQFPTKTELMLFVVRAAFEDGVSRHRKCLETAKDVHLELAQHAWEAISGPAGIAALEILMGARSDPQLAKKLIPLFARIEEEEFNISASLDTSGGRLVSPTSVRLYYWALRGLSIGNLVTEDPKEIQKCLELLKKIFFTYREIELRKSLSAAH